MIRETETLDVRRGSSSRATMAAMGEDSRRDSLLGRRREQQMLAGLLDGARDGRSGVLVIRGDAGIGKTALLANAVSRAPDFRAINVSGAESEMELAYAGVHQVCAPLMGLVDCLPT